MVKSWRDRKLQEKLYWFTCSGYVDKAKFQFLVGLAVRVSIPRYISVRPVVGIWFTANISFWRGTPGFDLIELWPISVWYTSLEKKILNGYAHLERSHFTYQSIQREATLGINPFREKPPI